MKTSEKVRLDLIKLYDKFLKETLQGKRLQKNTKPVRESSIQPYVWLRKLLYDFSIEKEFPLTIISTKTLKKRGIEAEKKYWKSFYKKFTDYLYDDLDCYDNYVGSNITRLRAFFNYLNEEKDMDVGLFHKKFYAYSEDIEIVTLLPEQLNYLIYNTEFEASLPEHLKKTKDMFVFGCTVALRVSDIFKLTENNVDFFTLRLK